MVFFFVEIGCYFKRFFVFELFICWFILIINLFFLVCLLNIVVVFIVVFGNVFFGILFISLGCFCWSKCVIFVILIFLLVEVIKCFLFVLGVIIVWICKLVIFCVFIMFNGIFMICFIELFNRFFNKLKFLEIWLFCDGLKMVIGLMVVNFNFVLFFMNF